MSCIGNKYLKSPEEIFIVIRFVEAEKMHLKAIQIKESLLGKEDYEVRIFIIWLRYSASNDGNKNNVRRNNAIMRIID